MMYCFCSEFLKNDLKKALFYQFTDLNATDKRYYCRDAKIIQSQEMIVVFGTAFLILVVNEFVLFLLLNLKNIEKHHTQ